MNSSKSRLWKRELLPVKCEWSLVLLSHAVSLSWWLQTLMSASGAIVTIVFVSKFCEYASLYIRLTRLIMNTICVLQDTTVFCVWNKLNTGTLSWLQCDHNYGYAAITVTVFVACCLRVCNYVHSIVQVTHVKHNESWLLYSLGTFIKLLQYCWSCQTS